jgi:hypothetical protein
MHWQQVLDHAETLRQLLGENLDQLAFEERQAVVQCLISKVVLTGEEVDISYVLPFGEAPQGSPRATQIPEGAPDQLIYVTAQAYQEASISSCKTANNSAQ